LGEDGSLVYLTARTVPDVDRGSGGFGDVDPWDVWSRINGNLHQAIDNNPVNGIDALGLWSLWRCLYTGDCNASDEVYDEALDDAADYVNCYKECMACVNKKGLALLAGAFGASPVPKPLVGKWPRPGASWFTSKTRIASIITRAILGSNSPVTKAVHGAANRVAAAPLRASIRGGIGGVSIAETAAAVYCASKCSSGSN
jgi:hypothetical protein